MEEILELAEHPNKDHFIIFPVKRTLDWVLPPIRRWNDRYNAEMKDAAPKPIAAS